MLGCANPPRDLTWGAQVAAGCPGAAAALGELLGAQALLELYAQLGLFTAPELDIETNSTARPEAFADAAHAALGLPDPLTGQSLLVSPLQMARAAATLSSRGLLPGLRLALAVDTPQAGWVLLPSVDESATVFSPTSADFASQLLANDGVPIWQSLAVTGQAASGQADQTGSAYTWYLGGTQPHWPGAPLVVVVLLEQDSPALAEQIGQAVLQAAMQP